MLPKPERVEVGQWWATPQQEAFRVGAIGRFCDAELAIHEDGKHATPCPRLLEVGTFLGSGEHPEPSEEMIEITATHVYESLDRGELMAPGKARTESWADLTNENRQVYRTAVTAAIKGREHLATDRFTRTTLSLYNLLRSLGKW